MAKVSARGGFSDRNGIKPLNVEIQLKDFDQRTRKQLGNMVSDLYSKVYKNNTYWEYDYIQVFFRFVLGEIYSEPIDTRKFYNDDKVFEMINNTINRDDYDDVLTLIELIIQYWDWYLKNNFFEYYNSYDGYRNISLYDYVNAIFEREYIGYRFVDEIIVPISDTYEIAAIQDAIDNEYKPVYEHLSKANKLLADRENHDYENSIKESISAVEAICEILTGIKGREATLGKMLKKIEDNGIEIHAGLKSAFNTLYGYTSDANGIRHAGDIGGKSSTFEEAKFMLVSCSAFINYLTAVSAH